MNKSEWQDISTAPKDGSSVLLWACGLCKIGRWDVQLYYTKPKPYWKSDGSLGASYDRVRQPTHWQPLPEGPKL